LEKVKANLNTFAPSSARMSSGFHLPSFDSGAKIIVVGAGAFGGWTALSLLRKGFDVKLLDAWGPGNARSSSADETRVIRSTYGGNKTYFDLNVRALQLWKEYQKLFNKRIFYDTGVLWLCYQDETPLVDESIPFAESHNMPYQRINLAALAERYPQINIADLHHAYYDPFGGYLLARQATQCVKELFVSEGGDYIQRNVSMPDKSGKGGIILSDRSRLKADAYVFACGSWLGHLFPDVLSDQITCSKQEVYYFGVPASVSESMENLPVWVDVDGHDHYYGIPGNGYRGFKIGVDIRGEAFDPTQSERILTPKALYRAREFLAHRFPHLKGAPLLEYRVCPYENSADGNFVFDTLPGSENVFVLGGGSGHGFKHGPALGELVADVLSGDRQAPPIFALR
jgi:glycine/D-amino acid oxidase-like deaminating enzyme